MIGESCEPPIPSDFGDPTSPCTLCEKIHKHLSVLWSGFGSEASFFGPQNGRNLPVKSESTSQQINSAVGDGWMEGGSFLSSILAGTLVGYLADRWLGTDPWLVVVGIIAGAYSGFMRIWYWSKRIEEDPRER